MTREWVCLMYHDIGFRREAVGPIAAGDDPTFTVTPAGFAAQLDLLAALGYRGVSLDRVVAGGVFDPVAITFDDGNTGQVRHGVQALVSRGMTATFFVTTDWIGKPGFASWDELREMKAAGMSIQSHSRSHPLLALVDRSQARSELIESKRVLDEALDQDTDTFALPGGSLPTGDWRGLFAESGYRWVATSQWGVNSADLKTPAIGRCTIRGDVSPEWFARVLRGDRRLAAARQARERLLAAARTLMGPTRYTDVRARLLALLRAR